MSPKKEHFAPKTSRSERLPAIPSRRDFLRASGTATIMLGTGSTLLSACAGATGVGGKSSSKGTIKILLWSHFVPRYDTWFDGWAKKWGQNNGVTVVVDHIDQADLPARTAAEFAAGAGHDLIEWITPASAYEPSVLDMTDLVQSATPGLRIRVISAKGSGRRLASPMARRPTLTCSGAGRRSRAGSTYGWVSACQPRWTPTWPPER